MIIAKDKDGYFVLDNAKQKVNLSYKGSIVDRLPTPAHIGLSHWHTNEKGNIITTPYEVIISNGDRSFKSLRYSILKYYANRGE